MQKKQLAWMPRPIVKTPTFVFLLLCGTVFLFCLFGIFTRPISHLSVFWPANAVFLGLLIRFPHLRSPPAIIGAFLGYILADLVTGNTFLLTIALTIANFVSVFVSLWVLDYIQRSVSVDHNKTSAIVPYLISVIIGGFCSALYAVMVVPYIPHTFMEQGQFWKDLMIWSSGETINYMMIVPICLAFPSDYKRLLHSIQLVDTVPFAAIMVSVVCTYVYFGPGALLYPLAALVWAASTYRVFTVTLINCLVCLTIYHGVGQRLMESNPYDVISMIISIRIGLITLSLTTMILCLTSQSKRRMFEELRYSASHDSLTAALNRRSFVEISEKRLRQTAKGRNIAIIMLDIDFFKRLNDEHGHYAGDVVLKTFSGLVQHNIRHHDLFCRMGGEEFVIFMENITPQDALKFANRLRQIVANTKIQVEHKYLSITVSMGMRTLTLPTQESLQQLLNSADQALYIAKSEGRNQVRMAG